VAAAERRKVGRPFGSKIRRSRFLTEEELARFMKAARLEAAEDWLLMSLTYAFALRVTEAVSIKWEDVNGPSRQLTIRGLKRGAVRAYDIEDRLWAPLQRLLKLNARRPEPSTWVFAARQRGSTDHLSAQAAKSLFKRICRKAGIADKSIHDLRHSSAMAMARAGDNLPKIAGWLRHTRLQSSMQYLIPVVDKAHERLMIQRRAIYL
jgi:integrase